MQSASAIRGYERCGGSDFHKGPEFWEFLRRYLASDSDYVSEEVKNFVYRVHQRWDEAQSEHYDWGCWVNHLDELIEIALKDLASVDPHAYCQELILQNPEGLALSASTKYQELILTRKSSKRIMPALVLRAAQTNQATRPLDPWHWPLPMQADVFYNCCCNGRDAKPSLNKPRALVRVKENLEAAGVDTGLLSRIAPAYVMVKYAPGWVLLDIARGQGKASIDSAWAA
ncbi:MAG: hypothetical protein K9K36_16705 [Desulfarculaceae bacterium]|nr:hypothetical protein [Desulfarculaceae bacterium]